MNRTTIVVHRALVCTIFNPFWYAVTAARIPTSCRCIVTENPVRVIMVTRFAATKPSTQTGMHCVRMFLNLVGFDQYEAKQDYDWYSTSECDKHVGTVILFGNY